MTPEQFFHEAMNLGDPEVRATFESVLSDPESCQSLQNKLGNFLGHFCEYAAVLDLQSKGFTVVKHPNGQKNSPDLEIEQNGQKYWIEHKNCSAGSYGKIDEEKRVPLRNYKHSYRNANDSNTTADLYYENESDDNKVCILGVCSYPLTKKFTWSYSAYKDLPVHPKHPGKVASSLHVPIHPEKDDIWTTDLTDIITRKDLK